MVFLLLVYNDGDDGGGDDDDLGAEETAHGLRALAEDLGLVLSTEESITVSSSGLCEHQACI